MQDILIVHPNALTPEMSGPTRAFDLSKALIDQGNSVTLVTSSFHYEKYIETKEYQKNENYLHENIHGVNFLWVRTKGYKSNGISRLLNWIDFFFKIYLLKKQLKSKPDIIIGSSPHPLGALGAYYLSRKLKTKFIFEFRDVWPDTLIESFNLKPYHPLVWLTDFCYKIIYSNSDHFISTLPYGYKKILEKNAKAKKEDVSWIPNGVDIDAFDKNLELCSLPNELLYLQNTGYFDIVYTGSLGKTYDLISLIDAVEILSKKYDNIRVTFVGNGLNKPSLKEEAKSKGLNNIYFQEPVEKKFIPTILAHANLLFATFNEGDFLRFGISMNKLQEYMLSGKPILMGGESISGSPLELSGTWYIVNAHDPIKIAENIKTIMSLDQESIYKTGEISKRFIKENYAIQKLGENLNSILSKVSLNSKT